MSNITHITIKIHFGSEVRRFPFSPEADFEHLKNRIRELYPHLPAYRVFWLDNDNDRITIVNQQDFAVALDTVKSLVPPNNLLRLTLTEEPTAPAPAPAGPVTPVKPTVNPAMDTDRPQTEEPYQYNDQNEILHVGITCDGCGKSPLAGTRYKCADCFDFDLCAACESKNEHPASHVLLKIRLPTSVRLWRRQPHGARRSQSSETGQTSSITADTAASTPQTLAVPAVADGSQMAFATSPQSPKPVESTPSHLTNAPQYSPPALPERSPVLSSTNVPVQPNLVFPSVPVVQTPQSQPQSQYDPLPAQLQQLHEMGFWNDEQNVMLIQQHGSVQGALNVLLQ